MPQSMSPSETMFAFFKTHASLSNKDLASLLLSDDAVYGDAPLRARINDRTFLSREVVHVEPGKFPVRFFSDFWQSALNIYATMARKHAGSDFDEQALALFVGEAAGNMQDALASRGQNALPYGNAVHSIESLNLPLRDRVCTLIVLFVVAGCTGSGAMAVQEAEKFAESLTRNAFSTSTAYEGDAEPESAPEVHLGLCRVENGKLTPPIYTLSLEPEGTEIGSMATAMNSIANVGPEVSRHHLRVFRGDDGNWYAVGLKSTNGTTVVRGEDKREDVIEPPRDQCPRNYEPQPVQIFPSDILCLARNTKFVVLEVS
jgi:hypothetical protein